MYNLSCASLCTVCFRPRRFVAKQCDTTRAICHRRHRPLHLRRASAKQTPSQEQLYEATRAARRQRSVGLALSGAVLALGSATAVSRGVIVLPEFDYAMVAGFTAVAVVLIGSSIWSMHGGLVALEWHDGRLWTELEVPPLWVPAGPSLPPGAVRVRACKPPAPIWPKCGAARARAGRQHRPRTAPKEQP